MRAGSLASSLSGGRPRLQAMSPPQPGFDAEILVQDLVVLDRSGIRPPRQGALESPTIEYSLAYEITVEERFAQEGQVRVEDPCAQSVDGALRAALHDLRRQLLCEGAPRQGTIEAAGDETVGRNAQAQLHERLGEQGIGALRVFR